jgi:hypothetical protein
MELLLLLAFLLACFLALILLLVTLLYIIPMRSVVEITIAEASGHDAITVTWLFLGVRIIHDVQGNRAELLGFGRLLYTIRTESAKEPATVDPAGPAVEPKKEQVPHTSTASPRAVAGIAGKLIPRLESLGSVIWQESRFDELRGNLTLGLGDPAMTGMCYGYFWAARFILEAMHIHLIVEPVFDRDVFYGDIEIRMSLHHPLLIIIAAIRLLLDPAVRELAGIFRQPAPGAAAL